MAKKLKKSKNSSKKEQKSYEAPIHSGNNLNNLKDSVQDISEGNSLLSLGSTGITSHLKWNNNNLSSEQKSLKPLMSGIEENSDLFDPSNSPSSISSYDNHNDFFNRISQLGNEGKSSNYYIKNNFTRIYKDNDIIIDNNSFRDNSYNIIEGTIYIINTIVVLKMIIIFLMMINQLLIQEMI